MGRYLRCGRCDAMLTQTRHGNSKFHFSTEGARINVSSSIPLHNGVIQTVGYAGFKLCNKCMEEFWEFIGFIPKRKAR